MSVNNGADHDIATYTAGHRNEVTAFNLMVEQGREKTCTVIVQAQLSAPQNTIHYHVEARIRTGPALKQLTRHVHALTVK